MDKGRGHKCVLLTVKPSVSSELELRCHSVRWLSGPYASLSNSTTTFLKKEENFSFILGSGLAPVWRGGQGLYSTKVPSQHTHGPLTRTLTSSSNLPSTFNSHCGTPPSCIHTTETHAAV